MHQIALILILFLLGSAAGLLLGLACVNWYDVSSFEGKSGYLAGALTICGGLVGIVAAVLSIFFPADATANEFGDTLLRGSTGLFSVSVIAFTLAWTFAPERTGGEGSDSRGAGSETLPADLAVPHSSLPGPDAPLETWLAVLRYNGNPAIVKGVIAHLSGIPELAVQLRVLTGGDDDDAAYGAFLALGLLPEGSVPDTGGLIRSTGQHLLSRIGQVAMIPTATEPGYESAARVNLRFSGWIEAFRHRPFEEQTKLKPLLRSMQAVASTRPDSHALTDIARVAGHYAAVSEEPG